MERGKRVSEELMSETDGVTIEGGIEQPKGKGELKIWMITKTDYRVMTFYNIF